jgi:hypothetical protein
MQESPTAGDPRWRAAADDGRVAMPSDPRALLRSRDYLRLLASLVFGAVLGPEAPLIAAGAVVPGALAAP